MYSPPNGAGYLIIQFKTIENAFNVKIISML
jgi:hypothetical protein